MKLQSKKESKLDNTIKYVFEVEDQIIEFSYIDNGTGKDIICVPCQTMCNMSCKFCHLTDHVGKIPLKNLKESHIVQGVRMIVAIQNLGKRPLLISYMGCGEPLDNIDAVFDSMCTLSGDVDDIRYGLATMLPKTRWDKFMDLTKWVMNTRINLKIHLSLHFTDDKLRNKWMPAALDIDSSMDALSFYHNMTGNATEVHYTIMDGVNDDHRSIGKLHEYLEHPSRRECTIKFMRFSEKDSLDVHAASKELIDEHMKYLTTVGLTTEYYEPPGLDIGASCGQFLLDV